MSDENYSRGNPQSFIDQLALKKRLHMLRLFNQSFPEESINQILDVGVTADKQANASNYLERYYPATHKIIALSNQDARFLQEQYPGLTFCLGDALDLPFDDHSIDVVFSSAVIEHVGNEKAQYKMLSECVRVAKKGIFITTPNRWHPMEVHTLLPFIHWLPKKLHRLFLKKIKLAFYADENNLNLLDKKTLLNFCKQLRLSSYQIKSVHTGGFVSNLILVVHKG